MPASDPERPDDIREANFWCLPIPDIKASALLHVSRRSRKGDAGELAGYYLRTSTPSHGAIVLFQ